LLAHKSQLQGFKFQSQGLKQGEAQGVHGLAHGLQESAYAPAKTLKLSAIKAVLMNFMILKD